MSTLLRLEGVGKTFPNGLRALERVDLAVADGEFVSLLGPSGCGKSTLLRLIAGLAEPSAGGIPEGAPDGGMAQPDLLLGSSYACDPRFKWYQATGKYMDVPTYNIDVLAPPVHADLGRGAHALREIASVSLAGTRRDHGSLRLHLPPG